MNTTKTLENKDKLFFRVAMIVSVVVCILVLVLNRKWLPRPETPSFVYYFPMINAFINGTCSVLLLISLYFIKQKNIQAHKVTNITTFLLSATFLILYVVYHYFVDDTHFPKDNPIAPLYFIILITHIVLAAAVLPLILLSFYHGLQMNVAKHKKLVRWTYPIWLYVTITGVIVYLMISPYYQF